MHRSSEKLHEDALAIWKAGVAAVDARRLVAEAIQLDDKQLTVGDVSVRLSDVGRIVVVGAGKAGAGMAAGVEDALGSELLVEKKVTGWLNVPEDCVKKMSHIHLHAARPAGCNEPMPEGVTGTQEILKLVSSMDTRDVCICLISGGGSALMPAPVSGVTLGDKQKVTQLLSERGANIEQLNLVRRALSRIKGGGLLRACTAGRLITLILSDVLGDPLEVIASGPTILHHDPPRVAGNVFRELGISDDEVPASIFTFLSNPPSSELEQKPVGTNQDHIILGNLAVAVDAAGVEAERRGYSHAMTVARQSEGEADHVGSHLAEMARQMRNASGPDCLISGGEPVVSLAAIASRGKGGRNQQLVLAALKNFEEYASQQKIDVAQSLEGIFLLSGGTDGEDGPTDAAGAWMDATVARVSGKLGLEIDSFLQRNDAYHFFQATKSLLITGPTHTNVCDLRVVVTDRIERG